MSALCQKQIFAVSFDHLVGGRKQRRPNTQTEHFRGLEING
jgi:hypothetical protein